MSYKSFQNKILLYYKRHGRTFPWRLRSVTPYQIFISEIMLQQTQADRVIEKYNAFIKAFPTPKKLANDPLSKIYDHWQGLGYNRRALNLKKSAAIISTQHKGYIPSDYDELLTLPGVGPYTASAILTFAFNKPQTLIETNIRTVYLFNFFKNKKGISDSQLLPYIKKTMYKKNPRMWYSALMDYGAMIKKEHGNIAIQSAHYKKQKPFKGSLREVRGGILQVLRLHTLCTKNSLNKLLDKPINTISLALKQLELEGFIAKSNNTFYLK